MSSKNKAENLSEEILRAIEILRETETLAEKGLFSGAVSRLYYYLFNHLKALMFSQGFEPKTHEGLERLFSQHFIKTNIFEHKDGKLLSQLLKYRWNADYNSSFVFTKKDYGELHSGTKLLAKKIVNYLKEKKYLK